MGRLTPRQIGIAAGMILLACLVYLGFSGMGRRVAMAATRPFLVTLDFLSNQVSSVFGNARRLTQENHALSQRVQELEVENAGIRSLQAENRQLRKKLGLKAPAQWVFCHGEILARDPAFWNIRFTIDVGSDDGISMGAPVLHGSILVGRIAEVTEHSSVVDTIASPRCHVGITLAGTDIHGLLSGTGRIAGKHASGCTVDFLPMKTVVTNGQLLLTSGLGRNIPPGIPVAKICPDDNGNLSVGIDNARKQAVAAPVINWDTMKFVSVIVAQQN